MALNKQRILSELGSVVNQLQSAECGCMGKLFSAPGQESSMAAPPMQPYGGCRMGCCHGHGSSFSGEPCSPTNNQFMHRPFLGNCNPPRLYADTYNYLNKNLMQPMVNEVYNDLKSISPENTIMNNPMASKMGLSPTSPAMAGQPGQGNMVGMAQSPMTGDSMDNCNMESNMMGISPGYNVKMGMSNASASPQMGQQNQYISQMNPTMGQMSQPMGQMDHSMGQMDHSMGQMNEQSGQMSQPMGQTNQPMNQMGGMGSQIMKMMMGDKSSKPVNMPVQNGQLADSMLIDAPQSPHGQVGVTPLNPPNYAAHMNYEQNNAGAYAQNPTAQHISNSNAFTGNPMTNNMQQQMFQNNSPSNNMNSNQSVAQNQPMGSGSQSMAANRYGQHTHGVKKFSEMFPGIMQGDLGFDPMAIAIQMNPANQQKAAFNTMEKLMNGNKVTNSPNSSIMQPVINAANAASANIASSGAPNQQSGVPNTPNANQPGMQNQAHLQNQMQPVQQQQQQLLNDPNAAAINQVPQQQVYTATTVPAQYQQSANQQYQQQQLPNQQYQQLSPNQQQPPNQQLQQNATNQQYQQQPPNQQLQQQPPNQQYQQQPPNQQYQQQPPNQQYQQQAPNQQYQQQAPNQQYQPPPNQQYQQSSNQQYQQQSHQYQTQQYQSLPTSQQQIIDPNTGAVMNSPNIGSGYEHVSDPNAQTHQGQAEHLKEMIMDPIFPADRKNGEFYSHHVKHLRNYHYNTLGQPIQMVDAKRYHPVEPPLPQTLSPQATTLKPRNLHKTFSNVKNTVSKTSIIGNGAIGRTPSRNQLQHLYNQYKGSHSYTQQNINAPVQHHSQSEGRLNENVNAVRPHPVPVEKVGGDTAANNVVVNQEMSKFEQPAPVPMGDGMPTNKPQGDGLPEKVPPMSMKGRNGLQDMVYTSGPTSAAWTFHGNNHMPYSTGYRFRTKVR